MKTDENCLFWVQLLLFAVVLICLLPIILIGGFFILCGGVLLTLINSLENMYDSIDFSLIKL